jgi:MFS family permease
MNQAEVRVPVVELIRKAGISEPTFYRWKAKYFGLYFASAAGLIVSGFLTDRLNWRLICVPNLLGRSALWLLRPWRLTDLLERPRLPCALCHRTEEG